ADYSGQEVESAGVFCQALGCGWRGLAAAEHGRVAEEVRSDGVACAGRHGRPASSRWPTTRILPRPLCMRQSRMALMRRDPPVASVPWARLPASASFRNRCEAGIPTRRRATTERADHAALSPGFGRLRAQVLEA